MAWLQTAALLLCAAGTATASILTPPVVPLAVRNPYLNAWVRNAREAPWNASTIFWTGQELGMTLMASPTGSNVIYPLFGRAQDSLSPDDDRYKIASPVYIGLQFDASTTNFSYSIPSLHKDESDAHLVLSFASPITPTSSLRQSLPASYISIDATGSFDLDVYIDINGDWVSGNGDSIVKWHMHSLNPVSHGPLHAFQIEKDEQQLFTEFNDRSEWGRLHFVTSEEATLQAGSAADVRRSFARDGKLNDRSGGDYRPIHDNEPIFAYAKHLSLKDTFNASALFTLTYAQPEVVQFASARGLTSMRPLWRSYFTSDYLMVMFHYADFRTATALARNYSSQLTHDATKAGGKDYADIVALSARQVLGATVFSGTPEAPLIFLKEISSNGNTQTVDVIFPSFPFWMYTNPRWLAYLLEPLFEHQLSGQYPNKYSMHDLGAHFPNLTGHADGRDEYMPVEECGDMLVMSLSLIKSLLYDNDSAAQSRWSPLGVTTNLGQLLTDAFPMPLPSSQAPFNEMPFDQYTFDRLFKYQANFASTKLESFGMDGRWGGNLQGAAQARRWVERSYRILKQWTQYLVDEALEPANQLCTDDFAGWLPLQTNLALKGIIGINAMADLSKALGKDADAKVYKNISTTYIKKWREYGMSRDGRHAKLSYDWYGSWTTLYSLFSDAMLCFHPGSATKQPTTFDLAAGAQTIVRHDEVQTSDLVEHEIYQLQSAHYERVIQKYGLPLDSRHLYTKSDWQIQAASVASPRVKQKIITAIAKWLNETSTDLPFSDLYDTEGEGGFGAGNYFTARPVVGSHFGLLALDRACGGAAWPSSVYGDDAAWEL